MTDPTTPLGAARCPWCGSEPRTRDAGYGMFFVGCETLDCLAEGPLRATAEAAVATWNAIPSPATHAAALRVVEAARKVRTEAGWLTIQLPAKLRKAERPDDSVNCAFRAFDEALAAFNAAKGGE